MSIPTSVILSVGTGRVRGCPPITAFGPMAALGSIVADGSTVADGCRPAGTAGGGGVSFGGVWTAVIVTQVALTVALPAVVVLAHLWRTINAMRRLPSTKANEAILRPRVSAVLAARNEGLGGTITTMAVVEEPAVKELFGVPDKFALAAVVPLGTPVKVLTKLKRQPVEEFVTRERYDGPPLEPR